MLLRPADSWLTRFLCGNRIVPFRKIPNVFRGSSLGTEVPVQQPCKG